MPKKIRPVRIEGNLAYVPLTQGYVAVIDASDAALISDWNWHVRPDGGNMYASRNIPKNEDGKRRSISMHREIMGVPVGYEVDHIDRCGLNNVRSNLRLATKSQNQCNRKVSKLSVSGVKGVAKTRSGSWRARISKDGVRLFIGYFKTLDEATDAYRRASENLHGQYGRRT